MDSNLPFEKSQVLSNLYERQLLNINKAISALHEDLQSDYLQQLQSLKDQL